MSIAKHSSYSTISAVAVGLTQWLLTVVIGRAFGADGLGLYAIATAIVIPVYSFTFMGLRPLYVSMKEGEYGFPVFFATRVLAMAVSVFICLAVAWTIQSDPAFLTLVATVSLVKLADGLSDIVYAGNQRIYEFFRNMLSMVIKSGLAMALVYAMLLVSNTLALLPLAQAAGYLAIFLLLDIRKFSIDWSAVLSTSGREIVRLSVSSVPLALYGSLVNVIAALPRLFAGEAITALGVFSAVLFVVQAGSMVSVAFAQSITPRIGSNYHAQNARGLRRLLVIAGGVWLAMCLIAMLITLTVGPQVLTVIYGTDFIIDKATLTTVILGGLLNYGVNILGGFLVGMGIRWLLAPLFAGVLIVTLGTCYVYLATNAAPAVIDFAMVYFISNAVGLLSCLVLLFVLRFRALTDGPPQASDGPSEHT